VIAVDFDGVLSVGAEWLNIGELDIELIRALDVARDAGCAIVLNTCREEVALARAVNWLEDLGVRSIFEAINENMDDRIAAFGGDCRKISADLILDDKASGWDRQRAIADVLAMAEMEREATAKAKEESQ